MNNALIILGFAAVFMVGIAWYADRHRAEDHEHKDKK